MRGEHPTCPSSLFRCPMTRGTIIGLMPLLPPYEGRGAGWLCVGGANPPVNFLRGKKDEHLHQISPCVCLPKEGLAFPATAVHRSGGTSSVHACVPLSFAHSSRNHPSPVWQPGLLGQTFVASCSGRTLFESCLCAPIPHIGVATHKSRPRSNHGPPVICAPSWLLVAVPRTEVSQPPLSNAASFPPQLHYITVTITVTVTVNAYVPLSFAHSSRIHPSPVWQPDSVPSKEQTFDTSCSGRTLFESCLCAPSSHIVVAVYTAS